MDGVLGEGERARQNLRNDGCFGLPDEIDNDINLPPALLLPSHLIGRVFSQLDCVDLLQCSLVCKQWYMDSSELRKGWKNEYLEAWRCYGLCVKRETHPPSPVELFH